MKIYMQNSDWNKKDKVNLQFHLLFVYIYTHKKCFWGHFLYGRDLNKISFFQIEDFLLDFSI